MSTKERFLQDIKRVLSQYDMSVTYINGYGIPDGTVNNRPNYLIKGFHVRIPNEDVEISISSKELIDYVCENEYKK